MMYIENEYDKEIIERRAKDFVLLCPECGDWEALYMDGKLVAEGHSIRVMDVLDAIANVLPNTFTYKSITDERAEQGFRTDLKDMFESCDEF